MHSRRRTRTVFARSEVAPRSQNSRITHATLLSRLAFLSLLITCALFAALSIRAHGSPNPQDSVKQQAPAPKDATGFLGDYSGLVPDSKNGDLLLYEKDPNVLKKYNKFIINPITIYLLPAAQNRGIDPDDLERLAQYFEKAVTDELTKSGRYEIVTTPGPDVLELDIAITNVEPTSGKKNAAVKGAATAATIGVAPGASLLVPKVSVGKVSIEGEIFDSASGERLVAFMTGKSGRRWFSGLNTVKKWGDIEAAFRSWAKGFRERLDEVHGT